MPSSANARIALAIGVTMIALGLYIGGRSLAGAATPLTSKPWLDVAFAVFFVVRGALQVRRWRQAQR